MVGRTSVETDSPMAWALRIRGSIAVGTGFTWAGQATTGSPSQGRSRPAKRFRAAPRRCAVEPPGEEQLLVPGNRAVIYKGPGHVAVETVDYPTLELKDGPGVNPANVGRQVPHGAILKVVATNICGSDQHMVRGRTTVPSGLAL